MANPWPTPNNRRDHGCICSLCSGTRYTDPPAPRIPSEEHQDGWFPGDPGVLQANRIMGVDNPTNTAAVTNGHWQTQAAPAVAPRAPENAGTAHQYQAGGPGPLQAQAGVGVDQVQDFDMSVPENLRRLAGRYVNTPGSLVNAVLLEPAPSGRCLVVIMVEVTDIF